MRAAMSVSSIIVIAATILATGRPALADGPSVDPLEARAAEAVSRLMALDDERVRTVSAESSQDVLAEDVDVCIDPSLARFDAICSLELRAAGSVARLLLSSRFIVTSVINADGESMGYARNGDSLDIDLDPSRTSRPVRINLSYGRILTPGPGILLGDDVVALGSESSWYPTSEGRDPSELTITVRYPAGYASVATGTLSGMTSADDREGNCPNGDIWSVPRDASGAAVLVGRLRSSLRVVGGLFVGYYRVAGAPDEHEAAGPADSEEEVPEDLLELVRFLESCYGPYPFGWLNVVSVPAQGGIRLPVISGPGLVALPVQSTDSVGGAGVLPLRRLVSPLTDSWWRFWMDPGWLVSSGIASQAEVDWLEATGNGDEADQLRNFRRTQWTASTRANGVTACLADCIGPYAPDNRDACLGKAAAAFGILRRLVGDEAYCSALRATSEVRGGGPVSLGTIKAAFERAFGRDLNWFFYEWFTRDDLPTYALEYTSRRSADGSFAVTGTIVQQGEFYRTPVPLTIDLGGWSYEETIQIESSHQQFTLRTESEPVQITVDSRHLVPKFDASERALAHFQRGTVQASSGMWRAAADEFGAAAALDDKDAEYAHAYGEALVRLGRAVEGANSLERAIALDPTNQAYRYGIALLYLRLSRYEPALRHLDVFVRARPEDREGHIKRTIALVGLDRLDDAARTLELARDLPDGMRGEGPVDADYFIASGRLLEARGQTGAAIRAYEAALAAYPVSDEARRRLAAIMQETTGGDEH